MDCFTASTMRRFHFVIPTRNLDLTAVQENIGQANKPRQSSHGSWMTYYQPEDQLLRVPGYVWQVNIVPFSGVASDDLGNPRLHKILRVWRWRLRRFEVCIW